MTSRNAVPTYMIISPNDVPSCAAGPSTGRTTAPARTSARRFSRATARSARNGEMNAVRVMQHESAKSFETCSRADHADPTGPACVPPHTPASLGLPDDWYSCRPGGARCYDALFADNARVADALGLMTWYVREQEEDIFELDNVLDADKAMRALWTRFVAMHRREFIANYAEGVRLFVDESWQIIHRAAGFSALRVWLLVRFIVLSVHELNTDGSDCRCSCISGS